MSSKIRNRLSSMRTLTKTAGILLAATSVLGFSLAKAENLAEIYNLALENDPQIRQARANYNAQHTLLAQGRSTLLPTVTFTANTARDTTGVDGEPPDSGFFQTPSHSFANGFNNKGYGLNISQNLLNFEAWYAFQSVRKGDEIAALSLAQAEQELIMRVATAYFEVLSSLDNLELYRAEEEAAAQVLEQTRERQEAGLADITDVYDNQANYDLAVVNRLVEENALNQRYEALEAITGISHRNLSPLDPEFPITPAESGMEDWITTALENNIAIRSAELDVEAKEHDARSAKAAMYPTLDATARYGWSESGNPLSFTPNLPSENTSISLNLTVPLYTGGLNDARKRQAYYTRDASEEALLYTRRESIQSLRNSYRSLQTDVRAVQARQQAIVSAESALEATMIGLEVSTRTQVDVVLAQRTLFQARRDYSSARYNYVLNTLNLKLAAGTLSPQDVIDLNGWLEE